MKKTTKLKRSWEAKEPGVCRRLYLFPLACVWQMNVLSKRWRVVEKWKRFYDEARKRSVHEWGMTLFYILAEKKVNLHRVYNRPTVMIENKSERESDIWHNMIWHQFDWVNRWQGEGTEGIEAGVNNQWYTEDLEV